MLWCNVELGQKTSRLISLLHVVGVTIISDSLYWCLFFSVWNLGARSLTPNVCCRDVFSKAGAGIKKGDEKKCKMGTRLFLTYHNEVAVQLYSTTVQSLQPITLLDSNKVTIAHINRFPIFYFWKKC